LGTVTIGGADPGDFKVTQQPGKSVAVGQSTTFTVTFTPTLGGTRTATVNFTDNDTSQASPFTFAVSGVATKPLVNPSTAVGDVNGTSFADLALAVLESGSSPATTAKTTSAQTSVISNVLSVSPASAAAAKESSIILGSAMASITASTTLASQTTKNRATDAAVSEFDLTDLYV
jgi:Abnormal spindle-like microcephaly-assoc'd, ASPM-SPD-2-Hydin